MAGWQLQLADGQQKAEIDLFVGGFGGLREGNYSGPSIIILVLIVSLELLFCFSSMSII